MGRRKIEIKPIKDDRNRSVTFLKRKGGLFKKAHELSVLCSVDVAVVIFGTNGKLYEYSSGDIRQTLQRYSYYGPANEHKGPADFADSTGGDDEDEDDAMGGSGPEERGTTPQPPFPGQAQMHHMRHGSTASQTPPVNNGMLPPQHRMSTPQPQNPSRPTSVNSHRRVSSNLAPQNHPNPQASQAINYNPSLQQHPSYYQQPRPGMQVHSNQGTPQMRHNQSNHQMNQATYPPPQSQMQQLYLQEQRRQSMPPNFGLQPGRPQSVPPLQHSPPQLSRPFDSPPMPGSPRQRTAPLQQMNSYNYGQADQDSMMPQQQWGISPPQQTMPSFNMNGRQQTHSPRAASIDVGAINRQQRALSADPRPPFAPPGIIQRARSPLNQEELYSSAQPSPSFQPNPTRGDSTASDTKRPRLAIQIPTGGDAPDSHASVGAEELEMTSSPAASRSSAAASTPSKPTTSTSTRSNSVKGSVVLPPPSPSNPHFSNANPLSAGATGPSNPFARPLPPQPHALTTTFPPATNSAIKGADIDNTPTPISALPSRFMNNELLPSPGALFSNNDWGMGGMWSGGGMSGGLTSPGGLFQPTPIRETRGEQMWGVKLEGEASAGRMETDAPSQQQQQGLQAEQDEQRAKRKIISPTEGWDERLKRGNWSQER